MRAFSSAVLGLTAIAVMGCGPVFGVEAPSWLVNAPGSHLYDGVPQSTSRPPSPGPAEPVHAPHASVVELHAPAIIVVRAPPGGGPDTLVNVTCATAPKPVSRFRSSPYGDDEDDAAPISPPYKPSPYDDPRPPRLYRDD